MNELCHKFAVTDKPNERAVSSTLVLQIYQMNDLCHQFAVTDISDERAMSYRYI